MLPLAHLVCVSGRVLFVLLLRLVSMWFCFVSPTAPHAWMMRSLLCSLFSARYQSVFSMGCMRRSCCSVMTSPRKMCCSCCARPLRSRRGTWWRLCCQVRQVTWLQRIFHFEISSRENKEDYHLHLKLETLFLPAVISQLHKLKHTLTNRSFIKCCSRGCSCLDIINTNPVCNCLLTLGIS